MPRERLRRSADFERCYREGRRRGGGLVTVHFRTNRLDHPRLGLTVSRRVGDAVVRNRLKRWTREYYRRSAPRERLGGVDLVVHFRPAARDADRAAVCAELERSIGGWLARGAAR